MQNTYDVVVVGYGFAGAAAAIAAADEGAKVLLVEKMPFPGGISITAGGGLRVCADEHAAFRYIQASNAGRTPDDNIRPIAAGMTWLPDWFTDIARTCGATVTRKPYWGNYPFPGFDALEMLEVTHIPDFDPKAEFPHAKALTGGTRSNRGGAQPSATGGGVGVFKVVAAAIESRPNIDVYLDCPVLELTRTAERVTGAIVRANGRDTHVAATLGVILACGGFESSPELKRQYWQIDPVLSSACRGNTGDGLKMAQAVGADLWHMWHFHGTYGFRHPNHPDVGIRMKRLPDWRPDAFGTQGDAHDRAARMAWVLLDQSGKRFMNEYAPYVQDTGHRPMEPFDATKVGFTRIPSWLIFDEAARQLYPVGAPVLNDSDPSVHYDWSDDNLKELDNGLLGRADSIAELADAIGVERNVLESTFAEWNETVSGERQDPHGRPPTSMVSLAEPPFYYGQIWPIVSNTQGGPRHDAHQRVLDPFGRPITGLYVAGELGSIWGHLYTSGCNLAECFVTGKIASTHACANASTNASRITTKPNVSP
ncbi:MAG: FAD-dependent oxidoreductase [Gammaproteobacteria bacterium]|nr:FAD-dependent oxidoreductase [Gammaproteobacteria bacterium]